MTGLSPRGPVYCIDATYGTVAGRRARRRATSWVGSPSLKGVSPAPSFPRPMASSPYKLPDFSKAPFAGAPEARFAPLPADGVLPEDFFSTSNLPTYLHVGGRWVMPERPRMDCVIV